MNSLDELPSAVLLFYPVYLGFDFSFGPLNHDVSRFD